MELMSLCIVGFIWGCILWVAGVFIEDGLNLKGIGFFTRIIGIIFIVSSFTILFFTISATLIIAFIALII